MKMILKAAWNEFVYGGHLVSLGLVSITVLSAVLLNIPVTWDFAVVIYFIALGPCLFGRYIGLKEDALTNFERSKYLERKARIIPYLIAVLIIALTGILIWKAKYIILIYCIAMIFLSFLYDLVLKSFTRKIVGFKNFFIGLMFSLLVVMLIPYYNYSVTISFWLVISFIYIMSAMGASFSDIKDIGSDSKDNLKTFAVVLGQKKLLIFLFVVIIASLIPIVFGVYRHLLPEYALMLLFVIPYNLNLFIKSTRENINKDFLYSVEFDSQLIWWLVFVLIGKLFIK